MDNPVIGLLSIRPVCGSTFTPIQARGLRFDDGGIIKWFLFSRFQTENLYQEVNNFYKENPLSAASMSIEQTLERIQNNITWIDVNLENFKKSL